MSDFGYDPLLIFGLTHFRSWVRPKLSTGSDPKFRMGLAQLPRWVRPKTAKGSGQSFTLPGVGARPVRTKRGNNHVPGAPSRPAG